MSEFKFGDVIQIRAECTSLSGGWKGPHEHHASPLYFVLYDEPTSDLTTVVIPLDTRLLHGTHRVLADHCELVSPERRVK